MVADKAGDPKSAADLALDAIRSGRVNSLLETDFGGDGR